MPGVVRGFLNIALLLPHTTNRSTLTSCAARYNSSNESNDGHASSRRSFICSSITAATFLAPPLMAANAVQKLPILEDLDVNSPQRDPRIMVMTREQMTKIGWGGAYIEDDMVVLPNAEDDDYELTKIEAKGDVLRPMDDIRLILLLMGILDKVLVGITPMPGAAYNERELIKGAIPGFKSFNKSKSIFPTYAKVFVVKHSSKNERQSEEDPLVIKVNKAVSLVSSCEGLLQGKEKKKTSESVNETILRVKEAQVLLAEFCIESGVLDEESRPYVIRHLALRQT